MTKEELKQRYSMKEIVEQYGFRPNRAGFIRCPFHTGDRDASLKIYEKDFHCFGCEWRHLRLRTGDGWCQLPRSVPESWWDIQAGKAGELFTAYGTIPQGKSKRTKKKRTTP